MEQNQDLAFTLIMKQMMNEGIIKKYPSNHMKTSWIFAFGL